MTISRLLYLGFGILIVLFVMAGLVAYLQIVNVSAARTQTAEVAGPLQQAVQEMEINALKTVRGVVSYVETRDFEDMKYAKDSQKSFQANYRVVEQLAVTQEQKRLGNEVNSAYKSFEATGDDIMSLADQRVTDHTIIRDYGRAMSELIGEHLQKSAEDSTEQTTERSTVQKLKAALEMKADIQSIRSIYESYMMAPDPELQKTLGDLRQEFQRALDLYRDTAPAAEEVQVLDQLADDLASLKKIGDRFVAKTDRIAKAMTNFREHVAEADRILKQEKPLIADYVRATGDAAKRSSDFAVMAILLSSIVGLVFGVSTSAVIQRRITRPLKDMVDATASIARGDLRNPSLAESSDEIGQLAAAFNRMVASLHDVLAESKAMTAEVATASSEIAAGTQHQVTSLTESATAVNQITTVAQEFKATMQEFADRARAVREAAEETGSRSSEGRELTRESVATIDQVRENARAAGETVLDLSEQMHRINEITTTVNEIAEQTKLLSLNASIEAARAGEEGRGFAVVATQVRELANQSKEAAGRIESTIGETEKSMRLVVTMIEQGSSLSEESGKTVKRVTEALDEIATAVSQTTEAMRQIAAGAVDQERGITDLANGIAQVDTASSEALAAAQQTQKSITAIDEQMGTLNDTLARFHT